jgi:hypothetical protein
MLRLSHPQREKRLRSASRSPQIHTRLRPTSSRTTSLALTMLSLQDSLRLQPPRLLALQCNTMRSIPRTQQTPSATRLNSSSPLSNLNLLKSLVQKVSLPLKGLSMLTGPLMREPFFLSKERVMLLRQPTPLPALSAMPQKLPTTLLLLPWKVSPTISLSREPRSLSTS